jgi:methylmalonyl-CoA mutase N-terminal domain/subunit
MDRNEHIVVGVNAYQEQTGTPIETLKIDPSVETEQIQSLDRVRKARDAAAANAALEALRRCAADGDNVMPTLIDAAKAHCSVGETVNALADVYGRFDGGVGW